MSRKPHKRRSKGFADPKDTAGQMADAVSYLCRVAVEEGLETVLPDLLEVQQKLEEIASSEEAPKRPN